MRDHVHTQIRLPTDHLLVDEPVRLAISWSSLTPTLKQLIAMLEVWLRLDPPEFVTPAAPPLKALHFDLVEAVEAHHTPVLRVCSYLTSRLAGCSMRGRFISEAPNVRWSGLLRDQLDAARLARNLNYQVVREMVDDGFANVHRVVIPLSFDGRIVEGYVIATEAVLAQ